MSKKANIFVKDVENKKVKGQSKNKIFASIMAFGFMLGAGLTLSACGEKPINVENVSALVSDYATSTTKFLDNEVFEDAIKFTTTSYDESNLLDTTYDLGDGTQTTLDSVKVIFTYKTADDEYSRLYAINKMTFETGISLNMIAEYDENSTALAEYADNATITTEYSTTYDAFNDARFDELSEAFIKNTLGSSENTIRLITKFTGDIDYLSF